MGPRTLVLVCMAHFVSHLHIVSLPPIFALMAVHYDVGFVELGFALTVFNISTTLSQPPVGGLVDRIGPRKTLMAGLALAGLSFILIGLSTSYAFFLILMAVAGLANSVYHPSDYAILSRMISPNNTGKAFSIHTFAGFLGSAAAPMVMTLAATYWSWQAGAMAAGMLGILIACLIPLIPPMPKLAMEPLQAKGGNPPKMPALNPTVIALTAFFFLLSLSTTGIQSFSVAAFTEGWGLSIAQANTILTLFLASLAVGVLAGGFVADRSKRHDLVAALGFGIAGLVVLLVVVMEMNYVALAAIFIVAGFFIGMVMPSRDILVHRASTPATTGQVFGIVTTGLNAGGMIAPPIFGYLIDRHWPAGIFILSAVFMFVTAAVAIYNRASE